MYFINILVSQTASAWCYFGRSVFGKMNIKREADYAVELESQFIMRLPEEPAKVLREVIKSGENFKNRLTIQVDNDMRHGEVRFDHWLLHAKIVDLPTIVESLKTIDKKSVYKTADICQMMICKSELDPASAEEESPTKNKKKDPLKVDKKFLWPHGVTPPTKNVRKRRFRKTLKKKSAEAPEIEKEVKRLLRADNEAVNVTWEVIKDEEHLLKPETTSGKPDKGKSKRESNVKLEAVNKSSSKVEDIFGGTLSDSDLEDENVNVDIEDSRLSSYGEHYSDSSAQGPSDVKGGRFPTEFSSDMFNASQHGQSVPMSTASTSRQTTSAVLQSNIQYASDDYIDSPPNDNTHINFKLQQVVAELEELKQRRQRTQLEISGMENMTLRQRFQDILHTLNKDIKYKETEYQSLQALLK